MLIAKRYQRIKGTTFHILLFITTNARAEILNYATDSHVAWSL